MRQTTKRWAFISFQAGLVALLALGGLALSGCGEDDPCATKTCNFGTCDSDNGLCTNREICSVQEDCIPGYVCGEEETCVAQTTCTEDTDCDVGQCRDGACVNPGSCESDSECLARTYCGQNGACQPDPCNDITCQRGVCERGTDNCVSASSCTEDTEALDCVAGQKCAVDTCETPETYCDEVTCDRGVCSYEEDGCINAMDCGGDEANCLEGYFCDDMNSCRVDLCEQNDIDCEGDGVCVPASGQCQNATSCESNADCLSDHVCVDNTCRLESVACGNASGDGGCPGNQTCEYDASNLTASCQEPDVCETSLDCKDGRQCGGQSCLDPVTCKDDLLEPNNTMEEASVFTDVAQGLLASGSLCQGDIDMFTFSTTEIVDPTDSGEIVVQVDVPQRDIGLGTLSATLNAPDGSQLDSGSLSQTADDGSVRLRTELGIPDHGTYSVSIQPGDQMSAAGLTYDLTVSIEPAETVQACSGAQVISSGQRVSGTTEGSSSSGLGGSCLADDETMAEKIYALELDRSREVTVSVNPVLSTADAAVSLRSRCLQPATEVTCVDDAGEGQGESFTEVLSAGTHYVIVQAPKEATLGNFELTVESSFSTTCGPDDNYCGDGQTAQVCSAEGGRYNQVACDEGCQPSTGRCFPPSGDRCEDAPQLMNEGGMNGNSNATLTRTIDLNQLRNDYSIAPDTCLGTEPTQTDGPEQTYEVSVPAQKAVTVTATFDNEVDGSLYFTESCSDLQTTCATGAKDSLPDDPASEELTYSNQTDQDQTRYLVIDTAAGQNYGDVEVTVEYKDVICTPGMDQCSQAGNVETCNEFGTAYAETAACGLDCESGICQGEACPGAIDIPNDGNEYTYSFALSDFADDYDINGAGCMGSSFDDSDGKDAVFKVDANAGDIFDLTWDTGNDPSLYVSTDCQDVGNTCVFGMEDFGDSVSDQFSVSSTDTYYIFADHDEDSFGSLASTQTLTAKVSAPQCTAGASAVSCQGSGNLQYCDSVGLFQTYSCNGGCSNGTCGTPQGELCADAKPMADGDSDSQSQYVGINAVDPVGSNQTGSCSFPENTAGADWVYAVDLQAGETLTADYTGTSSFGSGSCCDLMYLLKDCYDTTTCVDTAENDGSITYTASTAETVYVVMDHDSYTNNTTYGFDITINVQ